MPNLLIHTSFGCGTANQRNAIKRHITPEPYDTHDLSWSSRKLIQALYSTQNKPQWICVILSSSIKKKKCVGKSGCSPERFAFRIFQGLLVLESSLLLVAQAVRFSLEWVLILIDFLSTLLLIFSFLTGIYLGISISMSFKYLFKESWNTGWFVELHGRIF